MFDTKERLRIVIADDHDRVRAGLMLLLNSQSDMEVVGEPSDGASAIEEAQRLNPCVVVMDVTMPRLNGLGAVKMLNTALSGRARHEATAASVARQADGRQIPTAANRHEAYAET